MFKIHYVYKGRKNTLPVKPKVVARVLHELQLAGAVIASVKDNSK